jgi:hypothetical protein
LKWLHEYLRRFRPAGRYGAVPLDIARRRTARETYSNGRANDRDKARAEELTNLKLALAMFAVQLDMFEMRLREGPLKGRSMEAEINASRSDTVGRFLDES